MAFGASNISLGNVQNALASGVVAPAPVVTGRTDGASNYTGGTRGPNGEQAPAGYEYLPDGSLIKSASGGNQVTIAPSSQGQAPAPPGYEYGPDGKLRVSANTTTDANGNPVPLQTAPLPPGKTTNSKGELIDKPFGTFPTDAEGRPRQGVKVQNPDGTYSVANDHGTVDIYNADGTLGRAGASAPGAWNPETGAVTPASTQAGPGGIVGTLVQTAIDPTGTLSDISQGAQNNQTPGQSTGFFSASGNSAPGGQLYDDKGNTYRLNPDGSRQYTNSRTGEPIANPYPQPAGPPGIEGNGAIIGGPGYVDATSGALANSGATSATNLRTLGAQANAAGTAAGQNISGAGYDAAVNAGNAGSNLTNIGQYAADFGQQEGGTVKQAATDVGTTAATNANQLRGIEATEGPSAAQAQLQTGLNASEASNLALARSGHGYGSSASNLVRAQELNAGATQQAANASATLRAQENAAFRTRQAGNLTSAAGIQNTAGATTVSGLTSGANVGQAGLSQDINATNAGGNLALGGAQLGVNAQTAGANATQAGINSNITAENAAGQRTSTDLLASFGMQNAQTDAILKKYGIDRQVGEQAASRLSQEQKDSLAAELQAAGVAVGIIAMLL